jgi:hypothetical protein
MIVAKQVGTQRAAPCPIPREHEVLGVLQRLRGVGGVAGRRSAVERAAGQEHWYVAPDGLLHLRRRSRHVPRRALGEGPGEHGGHGCYGGGEVDEWKSYLPPIHTRWLNPQLNI